VLTVVHLIAAGTRARRPKDLVQADQQAQAVRQARALGGLAGGH